MVFPTFNFSESGVDYAFAERTIKEMYSYAYHRGAFQHNSLHVDDVLNKVLPILTVMEYDRGDLVRYQSDVQAAYQLLYSIV